MVGVLLPPLLLVDWSWAASLREWPRPDGALGAAGAMILAALKRLNMQRLWGALEETALLTTMVLFLLVGSALFTLVFTGLNGDLWVEDLLTNYLGGRLGCLLLQISRYFFWDFSLIFLRSPLLSCLYLFRQPHSWV